MIEHDKLRRYCKVACANSEGELKLKDLAQMIDVKEHSFYNYIKGYYTISNKKASLLLEIVSEWLDVD